MHLFSLLVLILACSHFASAQGHLPPADSVAITAAVDRWFEAWETLDAPLAAQDYAEDADWTNAFGQTQHGRAAIEAQLLEVFMLGFVTVGESQPVMQEIRFLGSDVALVRTRVERRGQQMPDMAQIGVRRTTHLRVFERRAGEWFIVSHLISDARETELSRH
jgi:uncharacterized protein (TIGR02246 family)